MPGDVQLTSLATKAAPLNYRVPGAAMIRVKSVRAEFKDNSAGGDWLPAVQLISDSGHVIATASDQGAKVTVGGSADASFFPGVKHGGGTVTINDQAGMWILGTDPPYAVDPGATWPINFVHGNGGAVAITHDVNNGFFHLIKRWQFFVSVSVLWENANFPRAVWLYCDFGSGGGFLPQPTDFHERTPAGTFTTSDPTGLGQLWCRDTMMIEPDANFGGDLAVGIHAQNGDAVARNIVQAYFACYAVNFSG